MSYGASQYRRSAESAVAPRDVEAAAFAFINRLLRDDVTPGARIKGLGKAHDLWSMLLKDVGSTHNGLPPVLKSDLTAVGLWAMRFSLAATGDGRSLEPLIGINEDMIAALRSPSSSATAPMSQMALAG